MEVSVTVEQRFFYTPDGAVWTNGQFPYSFWQRYLTIFDHVRVIARASEQANIDPKSQRVDGAGVSLQKLPFYHGPQQYLLKRGQVKAAIQLYAQANTAYILRVSSPIGTGVFGQLLKRRFPYGVEVVTDPYDVFAPGGVEHPLRPVFRRMFTRQLKTICADAVAAAYVTEHYLQQRYPTKGLSVALSSVSIDDEALAPEPCRYEALQPPYKLVFVGSLDQKYKAADILLKAMVLCRQKGFDVRTHFVGGGRYQAELEAQADALGLRSAVNFMGQLNGTDAVRETLDVADLFVMPSRAEGLPRAMVEAMARGLPCVGSSVGGIPELIPAEDRVPAGDVLALANKLIEVLSDPARLARMSARNLARAKDYNDAILTERRNQFYAYIKDQTQSHLGG
jgi:glycosyltransferase involved in cell wall biosynthesis